MEWKNVRLAPSAYSESIIMQIKELWYLPYLSCKRLVTFTINERRFHVKGVKTNYIGEIKS